MVIDHKILNLENKITIDYSKYFHESWFKYGEFSQLLESDYMSNLMHYIYQFYDNEVLVYPYKKEQIFNSFKYVDFEKIRVVIFNECPPSTTFATGNGFAESNSYGNPSDHNSRLIEVEELIKDSYKNNIRFDRSLISWNDQGVLVINTSLINAGVTSKENNYDRQLYFKHFIRNIIKIINEYLTEVLFVFTDDSQVVDFGKYIETEYHSILEQSNINEDSNIYDEINEVLFENAKDAATATNSLINW